MTKTAGHKLFEGFQSRPVRVEKEIPIEAQFPRRLVTLGEPIWVRYDSDKRDPGDPEGNGRQGIWKPFIHKHTLGQGLRFYAPVGGSEGPGVKAPRWPETVCWLGELVSVAYRDAEGEEWEEEFTDWSLWASAPNGKVLLGLPRNGKDVRLWKGGELKTTWRGVEG